MFKIIKTLSVITLSTIFSIFLISCEEDYFVSPDVPIVIQEESNWCWNASSVAILSHYGVNITQDEFARSYAKDMSNSSKTLGEINTYLQNANLAGTMEYSTLSIPDTQGQIDNQTPILAATTTVHVDGTSSGHTVVIRGYSDDLDSTIYYMDPAEDVYQSLTYDEFCLGSTPTGTRAWVGSIYDFINY